MMNTRVTLFLISIAAASTALAQSSGEKSKAFGPDEQALIKLEQDWAAARGKRDLAAIDRIVAQGWMFTNPDGVLIAKAQADENLKTGAIVFLSSKFDDFAVRIHGDTAVVFTLVTQSLNINGNEVRGQFRCTDTYVKRDGRWQCIASHVTQVAAGSRGASE
jgi:ketosteroid isomerase-like protein